jgi:hypothetical protein
VSRAGYYQGLEQEPSSKEMSDALLEPRINEIFWQHQRRYGARRIASVLQDQGLVFSPPTCGNTHKNPVFARLAAKIVSTENHRQSSQVGLQSELVVGYRR